jgi:hypothetical protein
MRAVGTCIWKEMENFLPSLTPGQASALVLVAKWRPSGSHPRAFISATSTRTEAWPFTFRIMKLMMEGFGEWVGRARLMQGRRVTFRHHSLVQVGMVHYIWGTTDRSSLQSCSPGLPLSCCWSCGGTAVQLCHAQGFLNCITLRCGKQIHQHNMGRNLCILVWQGLWRAPHWNEIVPVVVDNQA